MSALSGARILVPVTARRRALAERLATAGAAVDEAEMIAIVGAADPDALADAVGRWCAGDFAWLAVTSRNAVTEMRRVAADAGLDLGAPQPPAHVASVGESTLAVCAEVGLDVSLVPHGRQAASGIVADFPDAPSGPPASRAVLAPVGNLASPVLARGLARKGWDVTTVEAYRTVDGPGLSAAQRASLAAGEVDAVVLTSGSMAERLAIQAQPLPSETLVVAIGQTTAASAAAAGMEVTAVAEQPTYASIVATLTAALEGRRAR